MKEEQVQGLNELIASGFTVTLAKSKSDSDVVLVTVTRGNKRASFADTFEKALAAAIDWASRYA